MELGDSHLNSKLPRYLCGGEVLGDPELCFSTSSQPRSRIPNDMPYDETIKDEALYIVNLTKTRSYGRQILRYI